MHSHSVHALFASCLLVAATGSGAELLSAASGVDLNESLRSAAARAGILIGGSHNFKYLFNASDPGYGDLLRQQFSITTLGNGCKWKSTQAKAPPAPLNVTECLDSQHWVNAVMKGSFRLHNLCWGVHNPEWLGPQNATVLDVLLRSHVQQMVARAGAFPIVTDVVNEPFCTKDGGRGPGGCYPYGGDLKNGTWYPKLPSFMDTAFRTAAAARQSDSLALFVNDFNAEALNSTKAQKQLDYVKGMLSRGVPIDGVGLQMHVKFGMLPAPEQVLANMRAIRDLGLATQITEMDLPCPECVPGPAGKEAREAQAKVYGDMLSACLAAKSSQPGKGPGCNAFVTWGFTDRYTDLGSDNYPCIFDDEYQPKEAAVELLAVLQHHAAGRKDPTRPWAWT